MCGGGLRNQSGGDRLGLEFMVVMVGRGISLYVWRWVKKSIWRGQVRIGARGIILEEE